MFCMKCGEAISDGSEICPKCGANLQKVQPAIVYASQEPEPAPEKKKTNKKAILIIGICACIVAAFLAINGIGKANLKDALTREWCDLDGSIIKVLDISSDEIEYRLETGVSWLDTTLATYTWKPVGHNKIKISRFGSDEETITVEFNDDKTVLTVKPALTSMDDSETWYYIN